MERDVRYTVWQSNISGYGHSRNQSQHWLRELNWRCCGWCWVIAGRIGFGIWIPETYRKWWDWILCWENTMASPSPPETMICTKERWICFSHCHHFVFFVFSSQHGTGRTWLTCLTGSSSCTVPSTRSYTASPTTTSGTFFTSPSLTCPEGDPGSLLKSTSYLMMMTMMNSCASNIILSQEILPEMTRELWTINSWAWNSVE